MTDEFIKFVLFIINILEFYFEKSVYLRNWFLSFTMFFYSGLEIWYIADLQNIDLKNKLFKAQLFQE